MAKDDGISFKNEKMEGLCAVAGPRGDMGGVSTPHFFENMVIQIRSKMS